MSYDVSMRIPVNRGNPEQQYWEYEIGNITYNLSPMFKRAIDGGGINSLHGKRGEEVYTIVEDGIKDMKMYAHYYKELNPKNGWGSYEGALAYLEKILEGCIKYPLAVFYVS